MPEYIEKGKAINVLTAAGVADSDKRRRTWARAICKVDGISASDVAPVVHGHWEGVYQDGVCSWSGRCSVCGVRNDIPHPMVANYCPHCGAKMDGGEKDAEVQA